MIEALITGKLHGKPERRSGELLRELQRATAAEAGSQGGRGNTKAPARVAGALTSSPYRSALDDALPGLW